MRDRRILIEINVTSNVQTHAVPRAADHPVRQYFDQGVAVTLCTDGWLMCGVTLSDEYWTAHTALGFTREEIDRMILDAFAGAFLPWPERRALCAGCEVSWRRSGEAAGAARPGAVRAGGGRLVDGAGTGRARDGVPIVPQEQAAPSPDSAPSQVRPACARDGEPAWGTG